MKHIGRKVYHLIGGVGLLALYFALGRDQALLLYAVLFFLVLTADIIRLKVPVVNQFIFTRFRSFVRKNEEHKLTGTPAYVLGIGLSLFLFPANLATAAICFLAFGDVAATTIGERYGKTKVGSKSVEGTIAFIVAAMSVGFLLPIVGIPVVYWVIMTGAIAAAGVELLPLPINDNLTIPLFSGGMMAFICRMVGCG